MSTDGELHGSHRGPAGLRSRETDDPVSAQEPRTGEFGTQQLRPVRWVPNAEGGPAGPRPSAPSGTGAADAVEGTHFEADQAEAEADENREQRSSGSRWGRLGRAHAGLQHARAAAFGLDAAESARVERSRLPAHVAFAAAAAFYGIYELLTRGRMILTGSMWAETATNYYANTQGGRSWLAQLFATDAGYIPLPQRIVTLVGEQVGVPPAAIPYFYTGSALLLSGLIIGSICLPAFRAVIQSDLLRFLLAVALMLIPDFETRTFINFSYFTVVLAAMVTALAAVDRTREVPAWAWVLPVLVISKPGVLAVLPVIVLVAVVSRRRFRLIALASVIAGLVQAVQLAVSTTGGGTLLQDSGASLFDKLYATVKYSLGMLGRLVTGPPNAMGVYPWMFWGIAMLVVCAAALVLLRSPASSLLVVGASLVFFTMLIDCFTFSSLFTRDMPMLSVPVFDRRYVVAVVGGLLLMAGLIAAVLESPRLVGPLTRLARGAGSVRVTRVALTAAAALVFFAWFASTGWLRYSAAVNQPLGLPRGDVSQWEAQADVLRSDEPVVCVPVDPFGWVYGRNCDSLYQTQVTPAVYGWAVPDAVDGGGSTVTLQVPAEVREAQLASLALMVQPPSGITDVTSTAVLTTRDGDTVELGAEADLGPSGGLMQFVAVPTSTVTGVESVTITFDRDVRVGSAHAEDATDAIVLWMGQP